VTKGFQNQTGVDHKRWTLIVAILGSGIVFLDSTIVNVALPKIGEQLPTTLFGVLEGQSYVYNGYLLTLSALLILAGALNEREGDDGTVGNRDARYIGGFAGTWPPGAPSDPHVAWVRRSWERIRPYSTGGNYVNFQLAEDDTARTADAYRNNYERLRRVKAQYDPTNLFRVNRNIHPAA